MTLRHFKIFVAVCDAMNMTTAAEALFISPSAVSQAISELEKHYEVRLLERLSRKLFLTEAGEKLLSYARHIIHMNDNAEKSMKALHEHGSIRLGASVTIGAAVLPKLVVEFQKANPHTAVEVYESNTCQIENRLLTDETDIGLVEGEISSPDILTTPFMKDELVLVCGKSHRFAALSSVRPHDLETETFIIREIGSGTRRTFENAMEMRQLSWKASWVCHNTDTIKAAVAEGLGISVLSRQIVENEVQSGILLTKPLDDLRFIRTYKVAYHKNKYLTRTITAFLTLCIEHQSL